MTNNLRLWSLVTTLTWEPSVFVSSVQVYIRKLTETFIDGTRYALWMWPDEVYFSILYSVLTTHFFHWCCSSLNPLVKNFRSVAQNIIKSIYDAIIIAILFPRLEFYPVGEQMIIEWGQMRRIRRMINQFTTLFTHRSLWNNDLCTETLSWWNKFTSLSFHGHFVFIDFCYCLSK